MRTASATAVAVATKSIRTPDRVDEHLFGSILSQLAKLLWPKKTAAHLAAKIGCCERAAEFYLAGGRDWSGDAVAAIVSEVLARHAMRNVKVINGPFKRAIIP